MSSYERGTRQQDHLRGTERSHRQVGVLEWRDSHSNRDIDSLIDDIDSAIGRIECDANLRVRGEISRKNVGHAGLKQAGGAADPNDASRGRQRLIDRILRGLSLGNQRDTVTAV